MKNYKIMIMAAIFSLSFAGCSMNHLIYINKKDTTESSWKHEKIRSKDKKNINEKLYYAGRVSSLQGDDIVLTFNKAPKFFKKGSRLFLVIGSVKAEAVVKRVTSRKMYCSLTDEFMKYRSQVKEGTVILKQ